MSTFLPGNKRLLNEDNDDDPKTTDTSLSEKYDMSHTNPDAFTEKKNDKIIPNNDDKYKEETSKIQKSNESVDNSETSNTFCGDSIIKTTQKKH